MRHKSTMKAKRLNPGDCIGIVSPSWCGPACFPHRVERGVEALKSMGFNVKLGRHVHGRNGVYLAGTEQERASDIMDMFRDQSVSAIIASIGGDHSCHLLPHLDYDCIRENPKIFVGFSDITVLHLAIWTQARLVTFYGPTIMTEFAEYPAMDPYTQREFLRAISCTEPIGCVSPSESWTDEFLDWGKKLDLTRGRIFDNPTNWTWLKQGKGTGQLLGGCTSSLEHLRGTRFWPNMDKAILFLETSEEKPTPAKIDSNLSDYENMGILSSLSGLLVGRPTRYSEEEREHLRAVILERTANYDFPIITDVDFGHTSPMFTIPIGCEATIDSSKNEFCIIEPAVQE